VPKGQQIQPNSLVWIL